MSIITFLGDVSLLNSSMTSQYKLNHDFIFNLEYVITDDRSTPKRNKVNLCGEKIHFADVFNKKPLAVNLANNHIMDFGEIGFKDTVEHLNNQKIEKFGAGEYKQRFGNPFIIDYKNWKIALMGYSMFNEYHSSFSVDYFSKEKVIEDIELARNDSVDSIIVNMHWGIEQDPYYTQKQFEIGRFLIDNGVDLVIGHHSHCLQPFEKYKGKYIFYSLGNCIFPDFEVNAFYNEEGVSGRTHRKRQLKINKESYSVHFDVDKNEVVSIDKLFFSNNTLKKTGEVNLNKPISKPILGQHVTTKLRKRLIFLYSNSLVDGKLFDLNALRHEVGMKLKSSNSQQ